MDDLARQYYEMAFKAAFLEKSATAFQDFFSEIMEKRYRADFVRVQPKGRQGDWKCDGFLQSEATIFQCYAPKGMRTKDTVAKIDEDFGGAQEHWGGRFNTWIFVHNDKDGLGPAVLEHLLDLDHKSPNVSVVHWGFEELRQRVFQLEAADIANLLGAALTRRVMMELGLHDLAPVLDHLERLAPVGAADLRPIPAYKLEHNMLSEAAATLLTAGMQKSPLVRKYFARGPELQDKIAEAFRNKYRELRVTLSNPDEIFLALQRYAGGEQLTLPTRQGAILACLAFFFEECDIFDRPPEDAP